VPHDRHGPGAYRALGALGALGLPLDPEPQRLTGVDSPNPTRFCLVPSHHVALNRYWNSPVLNADFAWSMGPSSYSIGKAKDLKYGLTLGYTC
jgi:hypothetical protein